MVSQYTKEQYWKIYEQLPQELKEAVFSAETADHIFETCERNNVQQVSQVAATVGDVLMGVTMPSDFQQALQKDVGLKLSVAQAIAQEINRLVFYPVKAQLEAIHRVPGEQSQQAKTIGIATPRHAEQEEKAAQPEAGLDDDYMVAEEEEHLPSDGEIVAEPKPKSTDQYRESID